MANKLNKTQIKLVQEMLNKHYKFNLLVDGDAGKKTQFALQQVPFIPMHWPLERQLVGFIQHACMLEGINAGPLDGYWGPQTDYGAELLSVKAKGQQPKPWRDDEGIGAKPERRRNAWPNQVQADLVKYYGAVGTNQTKIQLPYAVKLAWNLEKTLTSYSCHEKVADSMGRVLTRVVDHYDITGIKKLGLDLWGGCLNVRAMRGGTKYSTHSWGIAVDWDPARNQLRWGKNKANFSKGDYDMWWKLWEDEGWTSLGRRRDYDWMHVQAANVK
jgi:hypothetical protein